MESKSPLARTIGTVPNSLTKTTVALLLAAIAVLVTAGIAMRSFIEDVSGTCPGTLHELNLVDEPAADIGKPVTLGIVSADAKDSSPAATGSFRLVYENDPGAYYNNVRIEYLGLGHDANCVCGSVPVTLSTGTSPYAVKLRYDPASRTYYAHLPGGEWVGFIVVPTASHRLQAARIFSRRHLSLIVSFAAFLALGVAWLRQRKARAYALVMHAWREAELTSGQMIQSETGEMLGALQSTSRRIWQRAGKVLVAPEALGGNGLYRDVPVIEPRHVARGDHAEWQRATMMRLRDARALAVLSTLTTALALAAHFFA